MEIVRLPDERFAEASAMLGRAFHDDPAWVWVLPDPRRRERLLPWLFRIGFEITEAEVWATPGPVLGCARWLPPGRPQVRVAPTLRALVATPLRVREATSRFLAYGRAVESLRLRVAPGPHWYLAGIGVDPSARRRGIGSSLLEPGLRAAEQAGVPCVLVTNSEGNLRFYERHGFAVRHEASTPEDGPRAWALVRDPGTPT